MYLTPSLIPNQPGVAILEMEDENYLCYWTSNVVPFVKFTEDIKICLLAMVSKKAFISALATIH